MANNLDESLVVHSSDSPGLVLVTALMNGRNFLTWRRSMKIALEAKMKLGFVDGTIPKPAVTDANFAKWRRVNMLVLSWILNSVTEEIKEGFLYADDARALWLDLDQRYGQCKGLLLYQIKRELRSISQGTQSLAAYFNKLKILWDELACLSPLPVCATGAQCAVLIAIESDFLMQFLRGLNERYEAVRNQILVMNPLPTVYRACSIIQWIESQRDAHNVFAESSDNNTALLAKKFGQRHNYNQFQGGNKGFGFKKQDVMYCDVCRAPGHISLDFAGPEK